MEQSTAVAGCAPLISGEAWSGSTEYQCRHVTCTASYHAFIYILPF